MTHPKELGGRQLVWLTPGLTTDLDGGEPELYLAPEDFPAHEGERARYLATLWGEAGRQGHRAAAPIRTLRAMNALEADHWSTQTSVLAARAKRERRWVAALQQAGFIRMQVTPISPEPFAFGQRLQPPATTEQVPPGLHDPQRLQQILAAHQALDPGSTQSGAGHSSVQRDGTEFTLRAPAQAVSLGALMSAVLGTDFEQQERRGSGWFVAGHHTNIREEQGLRLKGLELEGDVNRPWPEGEWVTVSLDLIDHALKLALKIARARYLQLRWVRAEGQSC